MLVLGRKPGERILIGDDIVVTVVRFNGGTVRLGIEAPRDFPVIREELKTDEPAIETSCSAESCPADSSKDASFSDRPR